MSRGSRNPVTDGLVLLPPGLMASDGPQGVIQVLRVPWYWVQPGGPAVVFWRDIEPLDLAGAHQFRPFQRPEGSRLMPVADEHKRYSTRCGFHVA